MEADAGGPIADLLATARPEQAAIRARWQHDAVPPWRRVEPTMVCEVRVTNLDLGRWARFPVAFVRWRKPRRSFPSSARAEWHVHVDSRDAVDSRGGDHPLSEQVSNQ